MTPPARPTRTRPASRPTRPPKVPTTSPAASTTHPADSPTADRTHRPVTLAVIIGAHGVTGEVRLKVFADDLTGYRSFNDGALTLKSLRHGSNGAIARFAEIADRNAAEAARGTALWVPRSALPPLAPGEYYHADLLGLPVVTDAGDAVGVVATIDNFGAGDVLEIERPDGKRFMVPMTPAAVPEWDDTRLVIDAAFAGA